MRIKKLIITLVTILILSGCSNVKTGKIEFNGNATDDELTVECSSPILIRKVEMVQYNKNEDGTVEMVLANYPIESFDDYTNPEFPQDVTNKVFFSPITLDGEELNEEQVNSLAYNNEQDWVPLTQLPENNGDKYGLVYLNGAYVTASDDWKLGEIRVTYYSMDIDPEREYSVLKADKAKEA